MITYLAQMFPPERFRSKALAGGKAAPLASRVQAEGEKGVVLVSNSKGQFVRTRLDREGSLMCAYFRCPLEDEPNVLVDLLTAISETQSHLLTAQDGLNKITDSGHIPKTCVGEQKIDNLRHVAVPFDSELIILAEADLIGNYFRSGDYMGLIVRGIGDRIVVVNL